MGMFGEDLTMLLGIELYEKGFEKVEQLNGMLSQTRESFGITGGAANEFQAKLDQAFTGPEAAATILKGKIQEVSLATTQVAASFEEMSVRVAAANEADIASMQAAAAATEQYQIAVQRLAVAQRAEKDATASKALAEKSAATSEAMQAAGLNATKYGAALDIVGKKAAIVTVALGAVAFTSAEAAAKFNLQTVAVANNANISEEAAKKITNGFITMSESSKFTATDIATSYSKVAGQLGQITGQALTTKQAMEFMSVAQEGAAASGQSLSTVTGSLAKIMQQLKIPVSQAGDAEAALYNYSRLTGQAIGQVTTRVSMAIGTLGIYAPSIQDVTSLMLDFTNHHVNARRASMLLNSAMNTMLKTGKATVPTMAELNTAAQALPASIRPYAQALMTGKISLAQYSAEVKKLKGNLSTTADAGYLASFQKMVVQAQGDAKTLNALKLTPVQQELSKLGVHTFDASGKFVGFKSIIEQVAPKLNAMKTEQERVNAASILFGNNYKQILPTILAGKSGIDAATKSISDHAAMQKAAEAAQNTYEANMQKVKNTIKALQLSIGNAFMPVMEKLMHLFIVIIKPVIDFMQKHKDIAVAIGVAIGSITTIIAALWAMHKVMGVVSTAMTTYKKIIGPMSDLVKKVVASIMEMTGAQQAEAAASVEAGVAADGAAVGIWAMTWPILAVVAAIALLAVAVYEIVKHWHTIWTDIKNFTKATGEFIGRIIGDIVGFFAKLPGQIWDAISGLGATLFKWGGDIINDIVSGATSGAKSLWNFFSSLPGALLHLLSSMGSSMLHFGENIIQSLMNGIENLVPKLYGKIKSVISKIPIIGPMLVKGMDMATSVLHGVTSAIGSLFSGVFHSGGTVPGAVGQQSFALVQGGETVLTQQQMSALTSSRFVVGNRGGSGNNVVVNVHVNGAVYGSLNDFQNSLGRHLTTTILPQAGVVLPH